MIEVLKRSILNEQEEHKQEILIELRGYQSELERISKEIKKTQVKIEDLRKQLEQFNNIKKLFKKQEFKELSKKLKKALKNLEELLTEQGLIRVSLNEYFKETGLAEAIDVKGDLNFNEIMAQIIDLFLTYKEDLMNSDSLKSLKISLKDAIKYLKARNLPVLLTEADKVKIKNPISFESAENFVLVHKTNKLIINNRLKTEYEEGLEKQFVLTKFGSVFYQGGNNTIKFTINGEKKDGCTFRYAVIIPFNDAPISQLKATSTIGTYFESGISLPESAYILCPLKDYKIIKNLNKTSNIIPYDGYDVTGYAELVVGMMGKKIEEISENGWVCKEDEYKFKQSTPFGTSEYQGSLEEMIAKSSIELNKLSALIETILDKKIEVTGEDINNIGSNINLIPLVNNVLINEICYRTNLFMQKRGLSLKKEVIQNLCLANNEDVKKTLEGININQENEAKVLNLYLIKEIFAAFIKAQLINRPKQLHFIPK